LIIEIKGVQFVNKGAQLMLLAILHELRARHPAAQVALAPNRNSPFAARARLGALQSLALHWRGWDASAAAYWLPESLGARLLQYGIVTEAATDAVLDASGFAYGDPWPERNLARAAAEIVRYARHRRPYVFLPQAFGPFERAGSGRRRFGDALTQATLIFARDPGSWQHLARLDARLASSLRIAPDFTMQLPGDVSAIGRWSVEPGTVLLIPNAHMLSSSPQQGPWPASYASFMAGLGWRCRAAGVTARLLNHEGADDAALCQLIARTAGGLDIIEEPDPLAVKGIIGAAAAVVCSRYHGCVSALAQAVPCLATSWSHKYAALYDEFGVPEWLVQEPDPAIAAGVLFDLLRDRDAPRAALARAGTALAARSSAMWDEVDIALRGERP
jgi:colanic acid/amylovoran biosynthesis protein